MSGRQKGILGVLIIIALVFGGVLLLNDDDDEPETRVLGRRETRSTTTTTLNGRLPGLGNEEDRDENKKQTTTTTTMVFGSPSQNAGSGGSSTATTVIVTQTTIIPPDIPNPPNGPMNIRSDEVLSVNTNNGTAVLGARQNDSARFASLNLAASLDGNSLRITVKFSNRSSDTYHLGSNPHFNVTVKTGNSSTVHSLSLNGFQSVGSFKSIQTSKTITLPPNARSEVTAQVSGSWR